MPLVTTYSNLRLQPARLNPPAAEDAVVMAASLTVVRGTVLGQITTGKKYTIYAVGASDGSQVARCIAMNDFTTDASGNVTLTTTSGQTVGDQNQTYLTAPVWFSGVFQTSELNNNGTPGVSTAIITDLAGHLYDGSITSGLLVF